MRVLVNGVRLFFDVDGAALVPAGPALARRPTLIVLHGGPGADHSTLKQWLGRFADIAQVVYLDHRGNGRSEDGPPESQTLAQWGDDLAGFCAALAMERPIVYGLSFGGFVAKFGMAYVHGLLGWVLTVPIFCWLTHLLLRRVFRRFAPSPASA